MAQFEIGRMKRPSFEGLVFPLFFLRQGFCFCLSFQSSSLLCFFWVPEMVNRYFEFALEIANLLFFNELFKCLAFCEFSPDQFKVLIRLFVDKNVMRSQHSKEVVS